MRQPKRSAEPATWAATIVGAMGTWVLLVLAYAVWPHEWLTYANSYLNLGKDTFFVRENQFFNGSFPPISIPRYVLADIVAAGSYFVFGTINVYLFSAWQKRKVAEPVEAAEGESPNEPPLTGSVLTLAPAPRASAYGRPSRRASSDRGARQRRGERSELASERTPDHGPALGIAQTGQ